MDRIAVNDLDIISTINLVERRKRKYLAITLNEIDDIITDPEIKKLVRKVILDNVNELTRAFLRDIFSGDVEGSGMLV
jgi:hypothetical protein